MRMVKIYNELVEKVKFPHTIIHCDNSLCSCVILHLSLDAKETWSNGIFHNSRYLIITIMPKGKRYYDEGDAMEIELVSKGKEIPNMRKTGKIANLLKYLDILQK